MKRLFTIFSALAFVALVGLTQSGVNSAFAKGLGVAAPQTQPGHAGQAGQAGQAMQLGKQAQAQAFVGTISKSKGQYVLQAGGQSYTLDNQSEAAKFVGKTVQVTGTLDAASNTIHVEKITSQ